MDTGVISGARTFPIYNQDGSLFNNLVLRKATYESVIMSLGDKITGEVYYKNNELSVTMKEYIEYEGVHYVLVSPPTILREGMVSDNSELKGMTKYSFVFYHPMYTLGSIPFTDVAALNQQDRYLSHDHTFFWIGKLQDFVLKLNANLESTMWTVTLSTNDNPDTIAKAEKMSEVQNFDKQMISDALKWAYETWDIPFVIEQIYQGQSGHDQGKRFMIRFGVPSNEIYDGQGNVYTFRFGQGVGLKNNSRNPKNNKIVTRIIGIGSENNIPYGYPQIEWTGDQSWDYTINNDPTNPLSYPIYDGIMGGRKVRLIKHPFARTHLMPSIYSQTVFNKVSPYLSDGTTNPNYNPQTPIIDYYDATSGTYPNPINLDAPSVEIHEFDDIKPQLGEAQLAGVQPYQDITEKGDVGNFKYIEYNELLSFIETTAQNTGDENERAALQALYAAIQSPSLTEYFDGHLGGAYTFRCVVTTDTDYIYVDYTSNGAFFRNYTLKYGHQPTPEHVDWDDSMDDEGKYKQSYFKVTLPILSFDIYAMASITEEMQINMRSGACLGCTFTIQVDWDDYKRNFYNADGQFDPEIHTQEGDGHVRDGEKYPDSSHEQITVIVKKDLETFGTIMPNTFQPVSQGDQFVILGISLPLSYISSAESQLDSAMRQYMLENNVHYYEYPVKFDEYFLAKNTTILGQIRNNTVVRFKFGNEPTMKLYVKQIVTKWQDTPLPSYDITLTDDIEIVLNQIGQVTDDVSRLRLEMSELQKYYGGGAAAEQFLSKVADDVARGHITFQQGLTSLGDAIFNGNLMSPNFVSGLYGGKGWRLDHLGNGEFESLRVRSFLEVVELLINRLQAQEGDTLFTDNDQIERVDVVNNGGQTSYILSLKEKWDGYFTSQQYGNVLKGIINTLAAKDAGVSDESQTSVETDGVNKYYTSWMRVVETTATPNTTLNKNQIRVVLYGDEETPAGKNFVPCQLMTIARWGCVDYSTSQSPPSEKDSIIRRQRMFMISVTDGRVVKYTGVDAPILKNGNYGVTIGELPEFVKQYSNVKEVLDVVGEHTDWLYAQGVVVGNYIHIDREGLPVPVVVQCGEWINGGVAREPIVITVWDNATQQYKQVTLTYPIPASEYNNPASYWIGRGIYFYNKYNELTQQYEIHEVRHQSGSWQCLQSQPIVNETLNTAEYKEPAWNSDYWRLVDGNSNLSIEFVSSRGYSFRRGAVNTVITPHLFYGNVDITNDVAAEFWNWTRTLENPTQESQQRDTAWNAQHTHMKNLTLTNQDMDTLWASNNKQIFTLTVTVNDGETTTTVQNSIIS